MKENIEPDVIVDAHSLVKKWIEENDNNIPDIWKDIGKEVYSRKTLIIAAMEDLKKKNIENPLMLAATDVFVEKAQRLLTKRARSLLIYGVFTATLAFGVILFSLCFLKKLDPFEFVKANEVNGYILTILLMKATSISALILGAIYLLVAIARALFHEGLALFSKRHALRFGRLYIYLNAGKINFKDLEEAFKWNEDFSTAFKDIKADSITRTVFHRAFDTIPQIINAAANALKKEKETENRKDNNTKIS
ncbi:MAG TPA: hypothetical protein VK186_18810 [Candidatus Deferrimicrobium sp.]|nr:hypothetical protein [Candidatus Deferrimicrobium sp.]